MPRVTLVVLVLLLSLFLGEAMRTASASVILASILSVILLTLSCREKSSGFIEIYGDSFLSVCSVDIPHAPLASRWHWVGIV